MPIQAGPWLIHKWAADFAFKNGSARPAHSGHPPALCDGLEMKKLKN
jgi:hypothetical protein